jgi:multicomponent K+:H+ antiporter subunit E
MSVKTMNVLRVLFPSLKVSVLLALFWLVLGNEMSAGQIVLAVLLGLVMPLLTLRFRAVRPPVRRLGVAAALAGVFLYDLVVANLAVARAVLGTMSRVRPQLVHVPLDMTDPAAIALLGGLVSLTPGTMLIDIDLCAGVLTIHVLLASDDASLTRNIKTRYESRIKEIFGC